MPNQITAYECRHCGVKIYRKKASAVTHEKRCMWNTARQACASCGYQNDDRRCSVYGLDLSEKWALRSGCPAWSQKPETPSF